MKGTYVDRTISGKSFLQYINTGVDLSGLRTMYEAPGGGGEGGQLVYVVFASGVWTYPSTDVFRSPLRDRVVFLGGIGGPNRCSGYT